MTSERAIAVSLVLSMLASLGLPVVYILLGGNPQLEGVLLAVALGGLGVAIALWAITLLDAPVEEEPRHPFGSTAAVEAAAEAIDVASVSRRRFLARLLAGAGGLLAAALVLPAFSLGPHPDRQLYQTAWRKGARVVGGDGKPIRPADLAQNTVRTVFPEGDVGHADSQTLLIRLTPADLRLSAERQAWAPDGVVGYSKICTHAGCPVGLYRAEDHSLLCPCHQSTFDVRRGAVPTFGPAARALPQLPLDVDADGYLVARSDYTEPVGPSFWNMTHTSGAPD
jgi:ubiquinol-cytochrome c reductase iron-sulfur subunit